MDLPTGISAGPEAAAAVLAANAAVDLHDLLETVRLYHCRPVHKRLLTDYTLLLNRMCACQFWIGDFPAALLLREKIAGMASAFAGGTHWKLPGSCEATAGDLYSRMGRYTESTSAYEA